MTAPVAELRDASVAIGRRQVLAGIDFSIRAGEYVVIAGPNGAGKSTLLRALAGLLPVRGEARLAGRSLTQIAGDERARHIAYLPQAGNACWPISVRDTVALGRIARRPDERGSDDALVAQAMADCDVARLADRPVTELSGGERARVLLARALAVDATLLLADEPTASLDAAHQIATMKRLACQAQAGKAVVAVTHDLPLALGFASRVVLIDRGGIVADGPPETIAASGMIEDVFGISLVSMTIDGRMHLAVSERNP